MRRQLFSPRIQPARATFVAAATIALLVSFCLPAANVAAQNFGTPAPRREQLLNGLRLLLLHRPNDPQVLLKLRINNGAAFDLAGKEGLTALLTDALFSDPGTRQYVTEELDGRLEVNTSYDHIEVTLGGKASDFERLAELLRNALLQMRLAPEDVARLRDERLKAARDAAAKPDLVADRAIAARLYGSFPYGRTLAGTPESLARIDRFDLMLARDRFLIPNNSTLTLVGGVEAPRAMRVFRQFLGSWRKSETVPPATFRRPDAPDARTLIVNLPNASEVEIRLAARGLARNDRDRATASVVAALIRERWTTALKEFQPRSIFARHDAHSLSGLLTLGATVPAGVAAQTLEAAHTLLRTLAAAPVSAAELERARRDALSALDARRSHPDALVNNWLDAVLQHSTLAEEETALNALTAADAQRVAARLFSEAKLASVVVGDAAQLRNELARLSGGIEVSGANANAPSAASEPKTPNRP
ncbi:MAG TPA: pitrilysin family protein [Pyrinomonadaceae bacterium]|nr:pitrilysin family protein [Pyrinomonadaceae bacterium]